MLDTFELEETRAEEKRQKQEKPKFKETTFRLPAYDSVEFWQMEHGAVEMTFGRSSTEITIDISDVGFTLKYECNGLEIEKDGLWSEFPKMFSEFAYECQAERCETCWRIYDDENDCPCFEDDENSKPADWNKSRRRFYGVRLGDTVEFKKNYLETICGTVCYLFPRNNSKIKILLDGGYKTEVHPEICTIIKKVEEQDV